MLFASASEHLNMWGKTDRTSRNRNKMNKLLQFRSVQFTHSVVSDSLQPHVLQHASPPCPSPTPGVYSNSCPLSWYAMQPSHPLSTPSSPAPNPSQHRSFPMSQLCMRWPKYWSFSFIIITFKEILGGSPSEWTGWFSLQSKGLSRVFSNTTVRKHQFFSALPSSQPNSHIHTWPQEKPKPWTDGTLLAK